MIPVSPMSHCASKMDRRKLAIIGAGPMGLAAAYYACVLGYDVEVLEAADRPGGMAAHFDFADLSLERFYHFCCKTDHDTFQLLDELGMPHAMRWVATKMGYFVDGELYPFGDPISLLRFPELRPLEKLRYAAMVFLATKRKDWSALDRISARQWFVSWCGERAYQKMWQPLLHLKFYEFADTISAAWVWQRIKRLGKSRRSIFTEELGYIEGGSQSLIDRLVAEIRRRGGRVRVNTPIKHIVVKNNAAQGVETAAAEIVPAAAVISTVPLPYVAAMLQRDAAHLVPRYENFDNVAVACVIHKLRRSVSPNFWVNVSDASISIPGFVEFSNLRPLPETIVYVPYYMPASHEKFAWPDAALGDESFGYLQHVNPQLTPADRIATHVGRLRYAQPVCSVGFAAKLPPSQTAVDGLQIADTSFYYPEDRGISESIKYAKRMVAELGDATRR
jgi:protoporphyrinogen oxidase